MNYLEIKRNLFDLPNNYLLAHCISSDFTLGADIAVSFSRLYGVKQELNNMFADNEYINFFINNRKSNPDFGDCIITSNRRVANLVTKVHYYDKPTLNSVKDSLNALKSYCINNNITKIAMPKIGCGLDMLNWENVSQIIKDIFNDTNIELIVCSL